MDAFYGRHVRLVYICSAIFAPLDEVLRSQEMGLDPGFNEPGTICSSEGVHVFVHIYMLSGKIFLHTPNQPVSYFSHISFTYLINVKNHNVRHIALVGSYAGHRRPLVIHISSFHHSCLGANTQPPLLVLLKCSATPFA